MTSDPRHPIVGDLSGSRATGSIIELGNRQCRSDGRACSFSRPARLFCGARLQLLSCAIRMRSDVSFDGSN